MTDTYITTSAFRYITITETHCGLKVDCWYGAKIKGTKRWCFNNVKFIKVLGDFTGPREWLYLT